jgi:hypothetical protein
VKLTEEEYQLLKLGPRFIYNNPKTAARRRTTELATLRRKIEFQFHQKKVSPGRPVHQFIAELDLLLQKLHDVPLLPRSNLNRLNRSRDSQERSNALNIPKELIIPTETNVYQPLKRNYARTVKRLRHKFRLTSTVLRKTDKSKVFHLGRIEDYQKKSEEYMKKTQAYQCLGTNDPLPELIEQTNKYLLNLRLSKWITQKQYEELCVKPDEAELAHLYYLPKAHKPRTPLRPIISGLRHPTVKISKFLDDLLRPLFDQMASSTTVDSGFGLVKRLQDWSKINMRSDTLFCTIDVADLYTMIPQVEGVLSLKKMLDHLMLKQVGGLKSETLIRLSRFVIKNNYFSLDGQFYHQIRGGAMGSPLTLTISNCYMFFFEQNIARQVKNSGGLYLRYIDDIFIVINWPERHLLREIEKWNSLDLNIKLAAKIGSSTNFLDLCMENDNGQLRTRVFHKPSYEPYYLPFNSIHPMHMKRNIPFAMLLRAFRYCSTFQNYLNERESLRMALLLNRYPNKFIQRQFDHLFSKFEILEAISSDNYSRIRDQVMSVVPKEKNLIDYDAQMFVHFTYCSEMQFFPQQFHALWLKYFDASPIAGVTPVLGTRNVDNLQKQLVHTKKI